jgi:dethiobiotin synthetase
VTRLFVTASGTELGKTYVTAALVRAARAAGRSVRVLKPVVSGIDEADPRGSDPAELLAALGEPLDHAGLDRISPWRFLEPLSPDRAAAREGKSIPVDAVTRHCRAALDGPEDVVLIEGVGGVMVPLDSRHTVLDWIRALDIPVLLVVGSHLGAISHALTAAAVLNQTRVPIRAVIVSESPVSPMPLDETAAILACHQAAPVITLPRGTIKAAIELLGPLLA